MCSLNQIRNVEICNQENVESTGTLFVSIFGQCLEVRSNFLSQFLSIGRPTLLQKSEKI